MQCVTGQPSTGLWQCTRRGGAASQVEPPVIFCLPKTVPAVQEKGGEGSQRIRKIRVSQVFWDLCLTTNNKKLCLDVFLRSESAAAWLQVSLVEVPRASRGTNKHWQGRNLKQNKKFTSTRFQCWLKPTHTTQWNLRNWTRSIQLLKCN